MAKKPTGNSLYISSLRVCKSKVIIYLSNKEKLEVSHDTVAQFYLYKDKALTYDILNKIKSYDASLKYFNVALNIISKSLISENALIDKLIKKGCPKDIAINIKNRLKQHDLINDLGFIYDYLEYGKEKLYGEYKIKSMLLNKGIKKEDINKIKFSNKDEIDKIKQFIKLTLPKYEKVDYDTKKEKIYNALKSRGFSNDNILSVIDKYVIKNENNDSLLKEKLIKDYEHFMLINKNKYDDEKELFNKLVNYLKRKRYKYNDIITLWREKHDYFN